MLCALSHRDLAPPPHHLFHSTPTLHIFDVAFFFSIYCKCNGLIIFTSVHIQCILEGAMFEGMTAEHISHWLSPCLYVHVTGRLRFVCTAQVLAQHD